MLVDLKHGEYVDIVSRLKFVKTERVRRNRAVRSHSRYEAPENHVQIGKCERTEDKKHKRVNNPFRNRSFVNESSELFGERFLFKIVSIHMSLLNTSFLRF